MINLSKRLLEIFKDYIVEDKQYAESYLIKSSLRHSGALMWATSGGVSIADTILYDGNIIVYCNSSVYHNSYEAGKKLCELMKLDFSKFEKPLKQDLIRYKIIKLNEDF